jgi:dipeptidyl aminopeptidase/acylaminoacyl peptidase
LPLAQRTALRGGTRPLSQFGKRPFLRILGSLGLVFCVLPSFAAAQTTHNTQSSEPVAATRHFGEVSMSPDGKSVAWVELLHGTNGMETGNSAVRCSSLGEQSMTPHDISSNKTKPALTSGLSWAPDNKRLALLSDAEESGQLQLYLTDCSGSSSKKLTSLKGFLADPRWSPDGKTIAVLFTENAPRISGPLEPEVPRTGEIEDHFFEQRIITIDVATLAVHEVSPADLYIYEYDWAPDGTRFVATAAHGAGDNNWWIAELYVMNAKSGDIKSIYKQNFQIAVPRWSPDGKNIAFISGIMSDEVSTGGDIYTISPTGESLRNLTPNLEGSASWLSWTEADQLLFVQLSKGANIATSLRLDGTKKNLYSTEDFFSSSMWIGSMATSSDGKRMAAVRSSFSTPPEVWAGFMNSWTQITHVNAGVKPAWGKYTSLQWKSDQFSVQGWLVFPKNYDEKKKYPMVVAVHGGPASAVTTAWPKHFFEPLLLSGQDYFVFLPNPRGSYGQGESFTAANVKDFGGGDLQDILRGVSAAEAQYPIDKDRIGITGWSYGGYMTMWAVTQTNIFRAAVAGAGLSNWQSYYGENEIDQWLLPYFGASVYDDPAAYAKSSPINFVKNVKTPTLMLVGQMDGEAPSPQSFEFWHALKALDVKTGLVVYPGEGHQFHGIENRMDANQRMIDWFNRYLKPEKISR